MKATHSDGTVREQHGDRGYLVQKRLPTETARLRVLAKDLHTRPEWTVTRQLMSGALVRISCDALSGAEAARIADEVKYARDWRGPLQRRGAHPEIWAINYSDIEYV